MKQILLFFSLFVFLAGGVMAQTQTVKGLVTDKQSEMPLIGATVVWLGGDGQQGAVTDLDGRFVLDNIPVGRQAFAFAYLGYEEIALPNVVVTAGKEVILNIGMEEAFNQLDEVVVSAATQSDKDRAQNEMATISARQFSLEEVNRYSGGRNDVARLAANFAGVSTPDDSRNDIVIRGNSPTGVLWRLEGTPIPSPNHFATLGTTGGPVSALNPNLMRNSDFLTSAFPAEYGNALAGVFDLGFRSGNPDAYEYTVQLGAVSGLEAMAEGPMLGGSFLVAGRYSFIGLASQAGLPIGTNATPNYSDLAFKLDFANGKAGKFTLFGVGGTSDIDFLHDEIDENDLFARADEDSYARSKFGVVGLRHNLILDPKTYLRTVISAATSQNQFENDRYAQIDTPEEEIYRITEVDNRENRISLTSTLNRKFSNRLTGRAGVVVEQYMYDLYTRDRDAEPDLDGDGRPDWRTILDFSEGTPLTQAFIQAQYKLSPRWTVNAGLHGQYLDLNRTGVVEPRAAITYQLAPSHALTLGYGMHHQVQPLPLLLLESTPTSGQMVRSNLDLDFTRSQHYVLAYDARLGKSWRGKAEIYYQDVDQVPVEATPSSFSMLNVGADFAFPDDKVNLVNEGTGVNMGLELTIEKFFSEGYYALLTASIYESTYKGSDGIERNTAFNNGYVVNVLAGKEFKVGQSGRHFLTLDTKLTTAGGRYYTPVDLEASQQAGIEILDESRAFSEQFDPYFRWDVKMGVRINSKQRKMSHQFFLDIQNVTNRENLFAKRYNRATNAVNDVFQAGFFPDFMYRIQF